MIPKLFDMTRVRVQPLAARQSMARIEDVLVNPDNPPPACSCAMQEHIRGCALRVKAAKQMGASVILMLGAHLVKNGGSGIVAALMERGWITHVATNGATAIHDWEFASHGVSTESVEQNVARGCFGTWNETGRAFYLALLSSGLKEEGFGRAIGRFIHEDGVGVPSVDEMTQLIRNEPFHPLTAARADMIQALIAHTQVPTGSSLEALKPGRLEVKHPWKSSSIFGQAFRHGVPATIHPGIGYDIITNHPMFNGAVIGRGAGTDFKLFSSAVEKLDGGVVISVGSAIMAPQVFEKSISCVNNIRWQEGRKVVSGLSFDVVDIQEGGGWDWTTGEPPKDNPAYYLRFLKSFSRMGGVMRYHQCDNVTFLANLLWMLKK